MSTFFFFFFCFGCDCDMIDKKHFVRTSPMSPISRMESNFKSGKTKLLRIGVYRSMRVVAQRLLQMQSSLSTLSSLSILNCVFKVLFNDNDNGDDDDDLNDLLFEDDNNNDCDDDLTIVRLKQYFMFVAEQCQTIQLCVLLTTCLESINALNDTIYLLTNLNQLLEDQRKILSNITIQYSKPFQSNNGVFPKIIDNNQMINNDDNDNVKNIFEKFDQPLTTIKQSLQSLMIHTNNIQKDRGLCCVKMFIMFLNFSYNHRTKFE
jgi:hypothetical protein